MVVDIDRCIEELHRETGRTSDPGFLKKCFRNYSSRAHRFNIVRDLGLVLQLTPPPRRLLDLGCGSGIQSKLLADSGYGVVGLETSLDKSIEGFLKRGFEEYKATRDSGMAAVWQTIQRSSSRAHFQFYDGRRIPFPEASFDVALAYAVLEHIPREELPGLLRGVRRILKPDGLFYVFQLPQFSSYSEFVARWLGLESHEYLWTRQAIAEILMQSGLSVIYWARADMLVNHPHQFVNPLFPALRWVSDFLLHTPLAHFAHHLTIVARRTET